MKTIIEHFINHLESIGYTKAFISISRYHLFFFQSFCIKNNYLSLNEISKPLIRDYQKYIFSYRKKSKLLSQAVQRKYIKTLEKFLNWCVKENHLLTNPTSGLTLPRISKSLPKDILTVKEMFKILNIPDININKGLRDKSILEVLYATGIRKAELLNLNILDINFKEREVFIKDGKGKKDRIIPISKRALHWLEKYLIISRPFFEKENEIEALFLSEKGKRFSPDTLQYIIRFYLKKSGIKKSGSCHMFRHSMATHLLENDCDIRYIQRILGHKDLSSTEIYLRVGILRLIEVHARTHPASGLGKMKNEK